MDDSIKPMDVVKWFFAILAVLLVLIGATFGVVAAMAAFGRYQRVADAQNQVQVNDIQIAQTAQLVQVEQQKAQIRIADAQGIAKSQQIIADSLTQQYLEYLAIQAQIDMANNSQHSTTIYIPSGPNGIPVVATQPVTGH